MYANVPIVMPELVSFASVAALARICPLSASTTAFVKPRVSLVSMARMTALIGSFATRIARPCALASRSVKLLCGPGGA
jgi:hypothetical protein